MRAVRWGRWRLRWRSPLGAAILAGGAVLGAVGLWGALAVWLTIGRWCS